MRLTCPLCGDRDRREFYYAGSQDHLNRPGAAADPEANPEATTEANTEAWDDMLYLRTNPAGVTRDLWYHESGCGSWLRVTRNTITHEVIATERLAERKGGAA